jgi:hypothetical protein
MVHEVFRAEKFAERRLRATAPITPGSRSTNTARGTYLPPKVKHVDAIEVRIAVAAVLAAAADTVLVAHHLPKLGTHLVTARLVEEIAWRQEERGIKGGWRGVGVTAAADDKQLGSFAAKKMKYTALCEQ